MCQDKKKTIFYPEYIGNSFEPEKTPMHYRFC